MELHDTQFLNPYQPPKSAVKDQTIHLDSALIEAFVGSSSLYYQKKWFQIRHNKNSLSGFNLSAMLYGPIWFLYRRMYLMFTIIVLILCIEGFIEYYIFNIPPLNLQKPFAPGNLIGASISIILGFVANNIYYQHALKIVSRQFEKNDKTSSILKTLNKRKTTDLLTPLSVTVVVTLLTYASIVFK